MATVAFDALPFAVAVLDSDSNIASMNLQFEEMMGPLSTLKGVNFVSALVKGDQRASVGEQMDAFRVSGEKRGIHLFDVDTLTLSQGMPIHRRFNWSVAPSDGNCVTVYGTQ